VRFGPFPGPQDPSGAEDQEADSEALRTLEARIVAAEEGLLRILWELADAERAAGYGERALGVRLGTLPPIEQAAPSFHFFEVFVCPLPPVFLFLLVCFLVSCCGLRHWWVLQGCCRQRWSSTASRRTQSWTRTTTCGCSGSSGTRRSRPGPSPGGWVTQQALGKQMVIFSTGYISTSGSFSLQLLQSFGYIILCTFLIMFSYLWFYFPIWQSAY